MRQVLCWLVWCHYDIKGNVLMKSCRLERSLNLVPRWHKAEIGRKRDYIGTVRLLTCDFQSFIMVSSIFMHG